MNIEKTSFKDLKNILEKEIKTNYENFIKALISIEKDINEMDILKELYDDYMDNDDQGLLNDAFDKKVLDLKMIKKLKE